MKPDWQDAPPWAQWLAMDEDGGWWWHESKPTLELDSGFWDNEGRCLFIEGNRAAWAETLESRPQTTKPAEAGSEGKRDA